VVCPKLEGAQLATVWRGRRTGGDVFDVISVSGHRALLLLLDISGSRTEALELAAGVQDIFRQEGDALFAKSDSNDSDLLAQLAFKLNRGLLQLADGVHMAAAFLGCYDERVGALTYINAGHVPGLVRHQQEVMELGASGLPLGLFSHATYEPGWQALEPGSALFLATRGYIEARGADGESFGMDQMKEALSGVRYMTAQDLCAEMMLRLRHFVPHDRIENDVTTVALVRAAVATKPTTKSAHAD
jgi:sigma-B regulation protein RsbU (phosphoserine phosphatase)